MAGGGIIIGAGPGIGGWPIGGWPIPGGIIGWRGGGNMESSWSS
jgi:hypothetical protein